MLRTSKLCRDCWSKVDKSGEASPTWKGGKPRSRGYVMVTTEKGKYQREHLVVWEKANNKKLSRNWIVHHINGIKHDNRIENLAALPRKNHTKWTRLHIAQKRIRELEQLRMF